MRVPRFSARSWFWSLTLASFVWAYLGTRTVPATGNWAQGIVAGPVHLLLVPGAWIVTSVQGGITGTFRSITAARHDTETFESLEQRARKLQEDVAIKDGQIKLLLEQIRNMRGQIANDISPRDVVRAYIVGRNMGPGSSTLNIDKGTADGVVAGMPVIAGENHIVGRVMTAYTKTSVVLMITDRRSKVRATIVHPIPGGTRPLLKEPCLVEGQNNGEFTTNTIKTIDADIEKGDLVQLLDNEWPRKLQYFILGVVSEVKLNPNQMLRYEVRTRANINDIQYVDVLTKF